MLVRVCRFLYKRYMIEYFSWAVLFCVTLVAMVITLGLKQWLRRANVLDRPNERSSHQAPTPRGGGIAILAAAFLGAAVLGATAPWPIVFSLTVLALVSWIDDIYSIPAGLRLISQAGVVIFCLLLLTDPTSGIAWFLFAVTTLAWMWFINLYNFMDGIDGITGVETISVCIGIFLLMMLSRTEPIDYYLPLIVASATAGFLIWNWHPAKIFMGDVGSIPLGFIIGWMLLELAAAGQWAAALILPAYYLADATITLIRRGLRGEKVWQAHKEHFYQRAHQRGLSHAAVSLRILMANILLIGLAVTAAIGYPFPSLVGAALVVGFLLFHLAGTGKTAA